MRSPESGTVEPKKSPNVKTPVETGPLSAELKEALKKEQKQLTEEREKLGDELELEFMEIIGAEDRYDTHLEKSDFNGIEQVRTALEEHQGDVPALQRALQKLTVPLLFKFGTLGKVKRFADSPKMNRAVAIEIRIEELHQQIGY